MDRTRFRIYVYACPEEQQEAAARLLREEQDLGYEYEGEGPEDAGQIALGVRLMTDGWIAETGSTGLAQDLIAAAPGARWEMWVDPDYGQPGEYHAYSPELGLFGPADCDVSGEVVLSESRIAEALSALPPSSSARACRRVLDAATGKAWRKDRDRAGVCPA